MEILRLHHLNIMRKSYSKQIINNKNKQINRLKVDNQNNKRKRSLNKRDKIISKTVNKSKRILT